MKKRFIANHAKSTAAVISLGVHAVLVIIALSFVAVTVIKKDDLGFEAKPVSRPKMQLKKLQVPVNIKKKKTPKPKLHKRILVKPKLNQQIPDIKMPEISGVKGGLGNAMGDGMGMGGGIGFSMPEINLFGVKSRGEKVFIILDSSPAMMYDEMGGIPAYTIIKDELMRIVESIGATTLFNIIVFDGPNSKMLFHKLVSANASNVRLMEQWIDSLNEVSEGMGSEKYGLKTLGPGGEDTGSHMEAGVVTRQRTWLHPAMVAQTQQADTIFLLTEGWGSQTKAVASGASKEEWYKTSAGKKWLASYEKGKKLLEEENRKRAEQGKPPRVLGSGPAAINRAYFPGLQGPPGDKIYHYQPKDLAEAFNLVRQQSVKERPSYGRLSDRRKQQQAFSFNVIHFVATGSSGGDSTGKLKMLCALCDGEYNRVQGLDAIQAYVSAPGR